MAATKQQSGPGTIVQSSLPIALATQLREHAAKRDHSLSAEVRAAVERNLAERDAEPEER